MSQPAIRYAKTIDGLHIAYQVVGEGPVDLVYAPGKVGGLAVNIGARVAGLAESRELLVSSTAMDLTAGSGLVFEDAGVHELKGIPEQWHLYRVLDVAP